MKDLIELIDIDKADFIIKWRLTEYCNIQCPYCIRKSQFNKYFSNPTKEYIEEQTKKLCRTAREISRMLNETNKSNVNIDLIGGEVSMFDLERILSEISTDKITKINLTTNFIRPAEYYTSLIEFLKAKNINTSITASFHFNAQNFETYFNKVEKVFPKCFHFTSEIVSLHDNQELCKRFKNKCEELGIDYMIEADIRQDMSMGNEGIMCEGSKKNSNKRYRATFADGTVQYYDTRNSFLQDLDVKQNVNGQGINTENYYCTNSFNYVYIEYDKAVGRTPENPDCTQRMPIEKFKITVPVKCTMRGDCCCTLCGHVTIYK